jgi:hypothetical protein
MLKRKVKHAGIMFFTVLCMTLLFGFVSAYACSILDKEKTHIGVDEGIRGKCSNNEYPITCVLEDGAWLKCAGPGGTYSGTNLNSLIFSACGCRAQEEKIKKLKEELKNY